MPRMTRQPKAGGIALSRRFATALRQLNRETGRRETLQKALDTSEKQRRDSLEQSRRVQEHLRRLSHEILSAQESERKRISRELHDEIGQTLTAINVQLASLGKQASAHTAGLKKHIVSTQRLVERSMDTVHRFARELRPPVLDDLGLIPALRTYLRDFTKRTRIPVRITTLAVVEQLDTDKRTVLYRVAQEALVNVAKHARATNVDVSLIKIDGAAWMEIHDNGRSFRAQSVFSAKKIKRLGLLGMRERVEMVGGTFTIESSKAAGTTIRAQIPFRNGSRQSASARARSVR
jgi:signal transduction histidine kinase